MKAKSFIYTQERDGNYSLKKLSTGNKTNDYS
jgi:hypothetical protein